MKAIIKFSICLLVFTAFSANAQEWEKNDRRSMESMVFDVVGSKEIKLPPASRMFDPVPPPSYQRVNTQLLYSFESYFYPAEAIALRLRPRPLAAVPEEKLYGNYIRAGFGNYATPFLDFYAANKRQTEFSYGMKFNYINSFNGPVDKDNSAQGSLGAAVFGGIYGDKITLTGDIAFNRDNFHYYGYDEGTVVDASDIEESFNKISVRGGFRNTSPEDDFQIDGTLGLDYQSNSLQAKETDLHVTVNTTLQVLEEAWTHVDGSFSQISRNDPAFTGDNRIFFYGRGGLSYLLDNLLIRALLRVDYQSDTLAGEKGIHIFPVAGIEYTLNGNTKVLAGIDGGIEKVTWNSLTNENLFLADGQYIAGRIKQSGFYAGISSGIGSTLNLNAGVKIDGYKNSNYFFNDPVDASRFLVVYDTGSVKISNPYASLSFNKDDKYRVNLGFDYFSYNMSELSEAWHRPSYVLSLNSSVSLVDKFRITFDSYLLGGITAEESGEVTTLSSIIDLNLGVEYFTGSRMSVFLKGRNLTGNNYMLYNRYPVKGIQVLGGISYKF